jgi:hypothetical protein
MVFLLSKLWAGLQALGGLLVPVFGYATGLRAWPVWLRWTVTVVLFVVVLVGLYFLNDWLDLEPRLRAPYAVLRRVWLPLLFVLGWLLFLLGSWLWQLLGPEAEVSAWPDVDAAWVEARASLAAAGVDLSRVPVFLVLGRPDGGPAGLFEPAGLVRHGRADGPIGVYAAHDGVFVACPGVGLLSALADALRVDALAEPETPAARSLSDFAPPPPDESARAVEPIVALLLGTGKTTASAPAPAPSAGLPAPPPVPAVRPEAILERAVAPATDRSRDGEAARLLRDEAALERAFSRLQHLCRRLGRERRPFCPVNALLLLVPYQATAGETEVGATAAAARLDLDAVTAAAQVECPVFALLADLESAPGCAGFVARLPASRRDVALGLPFPLLPTLEAERVPAALEEGVGWLAGALLPAVVSAMYAPPNPADSRADARVIEENAGLFHFAEDLRQRLPRFARLAARAVLGDGGGSRPLFGGCFLAATGKERAFAPGALRRLVETQNAVRWTAEARAEEAAYRFWTRAALAGAVAASAGVIALLWALLV